MAQYISMDYIEGDGWDQLGPTDVPFVKWIGTRLMDHDQFIEEGWERVGDRWTAPIAKVQARHDRLLQAKRQRRTNWARSIEADEQFRRDYPELEIVK